MAHKTKKLYNVNIDGRNIKVDENSTILEACLQADVFVPNLCYHPDIPPTGKCGICVVYVNGIYQVLACSTEVQPDIIVDTKAEETKKYAYESFQKLNDKIIIPSTHEIEEIFDYFNKAPKKIRRKNEQTLSLIYDPMECISCDRCIRVCNKIQQIGAITRGSYTLDSKKCISCGQCVAVCPTKALTETFVNPKVLQALAKGKILCLQIAPAVRVSVAECFGEPVGTICTGKIISAARLAGFKYVFDTNYGADLTVIEEANELLDRIQQKKNLPMFTSCCSSWVQYVYLKYPELKRNLSTCKSPHMMIGSVVKSYFAEKKKIDSSKIFLVFFNAMYF